MCIRAAVGSDAPAIHDLHTQSVMELCNLYTEEQRAASDVDLRIVCSHNGEAMRPLSRGIKPLSGAL